MKKAAVPSILVAVVLLALGVTAEAQQPKKMPRIIYLSPLSPSSESARSEAIRLALRELGYIEGLFSLLPPERDFVLLCCCCRHDSIHG
jgi:hypothetical protein